MKLPPKPFLTARWQQLAMLNYEIEPAILAPLVPAGTELDGWNGKTFVSMVGFRFLETRVRGIAIPFHQNFEEVNLRFYVRRRAEEGWRRGVVFIQEIVPRAAIALTARWLYNEPYVALSMRHRIEREGSGVKAAEYAWRFQGRWNRLQVRGRGDAQFLAEDSEARFITEHYWGYNSQRDGSTMEYRVEHPSWRVDKVAEATLDCDVAALYGQRFVDCLGRNPSSAFLAEGSPVQVYPGVRLPR